MKNIPAPTIIVGHLSDFFIFCWWWHYPGGLLMARILIVEDDTELQGMLALLLKRHGYDVYSAQNGVEALYQAVYYQPDLIILDLMMPLASGDAVLGFIRSTDSLRNTPVLVVSAHPKAAELAAQLEADDYLTKPVEMKILLARIETLLQKA